MRILWLSHLVPYPPKGGVLQRAYHLLREVSRYHDVDLLAFNQRDLIQPLFSSVEEGLQAAEEALRGFCRPAGFITIPWDDVPYGRYLLAAKSLLSRDPYNVNWLKSREYGCELNKLLASSAYDLIHFDTISLIPYYSFFNGAPCVLDHHNIESHMLLRRAEAEPNTLRKAYFRHEGRRLERVEKHMCPKFALNITCSLLDKRRLHSISPDSWIEEVPNGVDVEYFKSRGEPQAKARLIFAGTLSWYPNLEAVRYLANELWPVLKREITDISIDIIGANPPPELRALAERDASFRVHGFVDDVRPYLDGATVYVCPIRDGGGTKLKVLDAFAMGKAVVAHPVACEGLHVTQGRNVLFAETVDDYVMQIKMLLANKAEREKLGRAARELVESEYAYDRIGKRLSDLYEQCV